MDPNQGKPYTIRITHQYSVHLCDPHVQIVAQSGPKVPNVEQGLCSQVNSGVIFFLLNFFLSLVYVGPI